MITLDVISKSPPALASSFAATSVSVYVPAGTEIVCVPPKAFDSVIAARSEQFPLPSRQFPSPGAASCVSAVVLTKNFVGVGPIVGVEVAVFVAVFVDVAVGVNVDVDVAV